VRENDYYVFCELVRGEIEPKVMHDEEVLAFEDLSGKATGHALVVPKKHVTALGEVGRLPDAVIEADPKWRRR
jgi:histidine triad (HIT) family protein